MALSHPPSGPFSHANPPSPFLALGRGTLARTLPDRVTWGPPIPSTTRLGGPPPGPGRGAAARPLRHLPGPRRPPPALSPAGPAPGAPPQPLITDRTLRPSSQRLPAAVAAAVSAPSPGSPPLVQCAAAARPPSPSATPRLRLRPREDAAAARGRRPRVGGGLQCACATAQPLGNLGEPGLGRRPRPRGPH